MEIGLMVVRSVFCVLGGFFEFQMGTWRILYHVYLKSKRVIWPTCFMFTKMYFSQVYWFERKTSFIGEILCEVFQCILVEWMIWLDSLLKYELLCTMSWKLCMQFVIKFNLNQRNCGYLCCCAESYVSFINIYRSVHSIYPEQLWFLKNIITVFVILFVCLISICWS